ncbi:MAG TPA: sigma-70 family RNA polymerase sigma factor [Candidatus Krumholzibacteria bacterium]|nr:sigma-70 family RNA polymerase sigma factor [Candidatus Krumholzibacteria bacterium]
MMAASNYRGTGVPDEDLLRIARSDPDPVRRRAAAVELVTRYRDAVYLWCYRYTRDRERALDLSQDVLATVWQKIGSFEGRAKFSSWLFSVTRNRCIDASRRVDWFADDPLPEDVPDRARPVDTEIADGEDEAWLLAAIRRELAPEEQNAIWLRCIERLPVDEVTRILGLDSASGARAVLQRARRKLRTALEKRNQE